MISPKYKQAIADGTQDWYVSHLEELVIEHRRLGVHLSHCNFGEQPGYCKYGDEDCPALSEDWRWMGDSISSIEKKDRIITRLRERIIELENELAGVYG